MVTLLEPVTDGMIYYKNEPIGGMQNGRNIVLRGKNSVSTAEMSR